MLEIIRGFASGLTAKILIGLLIASFALWGVSGSILSGGNTVVRVGETTVDTFDFRIAYENQLNNLSQQVQQRLTREQANAFGLQETVLSQVVAGAVLDENTRKMGLGLSDKNLAAELAKDPIFQDLSGQFSGNSFAAYLRQTGLSEQEFLSNRRKIAMRNQIQEGTAASFEISDTFLEALATYNQEQRVFDYAVIGPEALEATPEPTDEQVKAYYEENKSRFRAPEYRAVDLLILEAKDLAKPADITDEELQAAYENRKSSLQSPERRRVEQLVLANQEEAEQVTERLSQGEAFDEIVSDLGKKVDDLDLGLIRAEELPAGDVRDAAFAAELNKPTQPVQGVFGPVILRVTEIEEAQTTAFDEIKDKLRQELALEKAGQEIFTLYDAIEDERAAGTPVAETAEKLDLVIRKLPGIDAQGQDLDGNSIVDLPAKQELVQEIFKSEPGDDTQAVPVGNNGYVWYGVTEIIPEREKTLDEVKDEAKAAWTNAETGRLVGEIAETVAEKIRNGEAFNDVLEATLEADSLGRNVSHKTSNPVTRSDEPDDLDRTAIQTGFSAEQGSIHVVPSSYNQHIVLRVEEVREPDEKNVDEAVEEQFENLAANDILNQLVQDFQSRESVSVNRTAMEQAFTLGRGSGTY